jgi:Cytochrome c7 and related cytochrome c
MNKLLFRLLLLGLCGSLVAVLAILYNLPLDTRDPSPTQPLPFSHKLHAGDYQIDCRFCHRHVEVGPVAGIPDLALCRACHQYIATDRPAIKQLLGYWERNEPIPWVRIHQLPDHVYFPHMMHIRAKVACSYCHGEVSSMAQLQRVATLKMGWCLNCHRDHQASIDCWTCHI